jgi:hypothetical protein
MLPLFYNVPITGLHTLRYIALETEIKSIIATKALSMVKLLNMFINLYNKTNY